MEFLKTEGGFVVNRPGRVLFVPVKSDGTIDWVNAIRNTALINSITATNTRTNTDIPDGNSFYPGGSRVTDIAGTIAIDFSTIDPAIWAMASGSAMESKTDSKLLKIYDYDKIDETGKLIINDKYKENDYIKVIGSDGTEYEKVTEGTSTKGEFTVAVTDNKTTLTFNNDAAGKNVAVTMYTVANTKSYTQGKKSMKNYKLIIASDYSTLSDSDNIGVNIEVSQVSLTSDMVDALQKDPSATKTLTFNMYKPLPGEQPYKVTFEDKTTIQA